jgi:hypothetical protein
MCQLKLFKKILNSRNEGTLRKIHKEDELAQKLKNLFTLLLTNLPPTSKP